VQSMTDAYYKKSREAILSRERDRSALVGAVLDGARRALRFAKLAMAGAPRGSREVTVFDQAPVAVVAASAPDVLAEVAQAVLGSLNRLPEEEREVLVGTLRTWLACGGSTEATAKALFCHPNTVRYRLNRALQGIL
jgi:DNA-binding PucR family transcriptional regulator